MGYLHLWKDPFFLFTMAANLGSGNDPQGPGSVALSPKRGLANMSNIIKPFAAVGCRLMFFRIAVFPSLEIEHESHRIEEIDSLSTSVNAWGIPLGETQAMVF